MKKIYMVTILLVLMLIGCNRGNEVTSITKDSTKYIQTSNVKSSANKELTIILKSKDPTQTPKQCENNELWIKYPNNKEELLVTSKDNKDVKKKILHISDPQFSPDKSKIYFLSAAWVTSYSVHVVDIKTKKEKYISPGNSLEVIQNGPYKGKLIVNQHRYKNGGGSYDHYYLLDEEGKEIKHLGENLDESVKKQIYGSK